MRFQTLPDDHLPDGVTVCARHGRRSVTVISTHRRHHPACADRVCLADVWQDVHMDGTPTIETTMRRRCVRCGHDAGGGILHCEGCAQHTIDACADVSAILDHPNTPTGVVAAASELTGRPHDYDTARSVVLSALCRTTLTICPHIMHPRPRRVVPSGHPRQHPGDAYGYALGWMRGNIATRTTIAPQRTVRRPDASYRLLRPGRYRRPTGQPPTRTRHLRARHLPQTRGVVPAVRKHLHARCPTGELRKHPRYGTETGAEVIHLFY